MTHSILPSSLFRRLISSIFSFETGFGLFLFAGSFKSSEYLNWFPIDLTLFFFIASFLTGAWVFWKRGFSVSRQAWLLLGATMLFAGWVVLSLLWAPFTQYGVQKAIRFAILNVWALAGAAVILDGQRERLNRFYGVIIVLALFFAMETMRVYLPHRDVRSYAVFGATYQHVGRLVGLGFVLAVAAFLCRHDHKWFTAGLLVISTMFFFVLLFVGSRGPFLAAMLVMALILLLTEASFAKKALFVSLLIIIYLAGTITMGPSLRTMYRFNVILAHEAGWQLPGTVPTPTPSPTPKPKPSKKPTQAAVSKPAPAATPAPRPTPKPRIPTPEEIPNESIEWRKTRFTNALRLWLTTPLIGAGIGSFAYFYPADQFRVYPHNMILEVLSELGVIGLFLWLGMIAIALSGLFKTQQWREPMVIMALGFFTFTFLNAMISGDIVSNRLLFTSLGALVATTGLWKSKP